MAKVPGWVVLQNTIDDAARYSADVSVAKPPQPNWDAEKFLILATMTGGLEQALQGLYDRLERLHQKIDRNEKKIGSA